LPLLERESQLPENPRLLREKRVPVPMMGRVLLRLVALLAERVLELHQGLASLSLQHPQLGQALELREKQEPVGFEKFPFPGLVFPMVVQIAVLISVL